MKSIYTIIIALVLFASCNQNPQNPLPPAPGTGTISYTINDTQNVSFTTQSYATTHALPCGGIMFSTVDASVLGRMFQFAIYTDFPTIGNTYYDTFSNVCGKQQLVFMITEGNGILRSNSGFLTNTPIDNQITITALNDSLISGKFRCRVKRASAQDIDTMNVTNGVFTNVNYMQN